MLTASEVMDEFGAWLSDWPDTPARRWVLENPPLVGDLHRAIRTVEVRGMPRGYYQPTS